MDTKTKNRIIGLAVIAVAVVIGIKLLPLVLNLVFLAVVAGAAYFGYLWLKKKGNN